MSNKRNAYLITRNLLNFLGASILTMLSMQMTSTVDGMVVGRAIGSDALSGVNALLSVNLVMSALANLFGLGGNIRFSRLIGKRDSKRAGQAFSTAVLTLLAAGAVMTVALSVSNRRLCGLLIDDPRIIPYSEAYLRVSAFLPIFMMLGTFLCSCLEVEGKPKVACAIVLGSNLVNVLLDIVFVYTFKMGIGGAALATIICYLCEIVLAWLIGLRKSEVCRFTLRLPHFGEEFLGNLREGLGNAVTSVATGVLTFLLIILINKAGGTAATNIWSVLINILMLMLMSATGIANAVVAIGSRLVGERDYTGLSMLYRLGLKLCLIVAGAFMVVLLVIPGFLLRLFGASAEMMEAGAVAATRIFSLTFIPLALVFFRQALFTVLQYYTMSVISSVGMLVFILAGVWFTATQAPAYLWWGFPASLLLLNLVLSLAIYLIHRSKPGTSPLTLIPKGDRAQLADFSIPYTHEALSAALEEMHALLKSRGLPAALCYKAMLLIEELSVNILKFAAKGKGDQRMDIRISLQGEPGRRILVLTMQDDGKPFNPTLSEQETPSRRSIVDRHLGLRLVNHLGANITYRYMYGQNLLMAELREEPAEEGGKA